jgi:hypothetical protein
MTAIDRIGDAPTRIRDMEDMVLSIEDFDEGIKTGVFTDAGGYGHFVTHANPNKVHVYPIVPSRWFEYTNAIIWYNITKIVWYNR